MKKIILLIQAIFFLSFISQSLATEQYKSVVLAKDLANPWSLVFLPNEDILIAEKKGTLVRIQPNGKRSIAARFEDVAVRGQGGFMDLTLHPQFSRNGLIYYSYTAKNSHNRYGTVLARMHWDGKKVTSKEILLRADNFAYRRVHFGSRIVFDDKGFLYLCLGERGEPSQAQNLANHKGKVLRLTADGKVPPDNPFVHLKDARPEIYSYGHRNPQGMVFENNRLWLHEHGPRGGDEINLIKKGANYGWPVISYGINYDGSRVGQGKAAQAGMEQPLLYWTPSIAPSGMIRYTGKKFPAWRGDFFVGALAGRHLRHVIMDGNTIQAQSKLLDDKARIREVAQDKKGYIYVLTDGGNGQLIRLEPN